MYSTHAYWLAALHLPHFSPRKFLRWLSSFHCIEQLFAAPTDVLQALGISHPVIQAIQHPQWQAVEKELAWLEAGSDRHLVLFTDDTYPSLLKETPDPPLLLYVHGSITVLQKAQMAMVGSRHPTAVGEKTAEQFAAALARTGLVITSGLAKGIDYASHQGALSVSGQTIAVAGTGLNQCYPRTHRALSEAIISQQGAIISEFPVNTPPHPFHFPRRNRIISGLSLGVLVVEAALKSGSLITARHALEQGRDVFAIPGSIHQPLARGCHALIQQGAKLVETAEDIVEELGALYAFTQAKSAPAKEELLDISIDCQQLLTHVRAEITPMDIIILRSGLTASEVSSMLLTLELEGYIQAATGGYCKIA